MNSRRHKIGAIKSYENGRLSTEVTRAAKKRQDFGRRKLDERSSLVGSTAYGKTTKMTALMAADKKCETDLDRRGHLSTMHSVAGAMVDTSVEEMTKVIS